MQSGPGIQTALIVSYSIECRIDIGSDHSRIRKRNEPRIQTRAPGAKRSCLRSGCGCICDFIQIIALDRTTTTSAPITQRSEFLVASFDMRWYLQLLRLHHFTFIIHTPLHCPETNSVRNTRVIFSHETHSIQTKARKRGYKHYFHVLCADESQDS